MSTPWPATVAILDLLTAVCATLNLTYFCHRLWRQPPDTPSRRAAAVVLAVVSLGSLVESVALVAVGARGDVAVLASSEWALVRALLLAGVFGISALVARRWLSEMRGGK